MKDSLLKIWLMVRSLFSYVCAFIIGVLFFIPVLILAAILPERIRMCNPVIFWFLHMTYLGTTWAFLGRVPSTHGR